MPLDSPTTEAPRTTNLLLPNGTRVEVRCFHGPERKAAGSVGVVYQVPLDADHAYLVRFAVGKEAALRRHELSILKEHCGEEMDAAAEHADDMARLRPCIIYACVVGSRAYGLPEEWAADQAGLGATLGWAEAGNGSTTGVGGGRRGGWSRLQAPFCLGGSRAASGPIRSPWRRARLYRAPSADCLSE